MNLTEQESSYRRLGEWRKFAGLTGIQVDRRSGLERRSGTERRHPDLPTLWMRPERRIVDDRRASHERRVVEERRSGGERRLH